MKIFVLFIICTIFCSGIFSQNCPPQLGGCYIFPPICEWNRPIDTDPVDFRSTCFIQSIITWIQSSNGPYIRLDMGVSLSQGYGIPFNIAANPSQNPLVWPSGSYYSQSDCYINGILTRPCENGSNAPTDSTLPLPQNASIEGGTPTNPNPTSGDRHMIVIDSANCFLYETFSTVRQTQGFSVVSSAAFNLSENLPQRPDTWTSADAAGLPILPGLLRYEDVSTGEINHALRFTVERASMAFTHPATHYGPYQSTNDLYYGARLRLKASFNESAFTDPQSLIFIRALKKYGIIFADQGSGVFVTGTTSTFWNSTFFSEINQSPRIHIDNFEVVQSPFPVQFGWSGASPNCSGNTANSNPNWKPTWNPVCSQFFGSTTGGSNVSGQDKLFFSLSFFILMIGFCFLF